MDTNSTKNLQKINTDFRINIESIRFQQNIQHRTKESTQFQRKKSPTVEQKNQRNFSAKNQHRFQNSTKKQHDRLNTNSTKNLHKINAEFRINTKFNINKKSTQLKFRCQLQRC